MGKSKKSGETLTYTKEKTPLLHLSGNLQENLEVSPCLTFSCSTRRRCHRSVRGTSILQLVMSSPCSVCVFHLCVLPLPYCLGHVVDRFTTVMKARTRRMFWIKSIYETVTVISILCQGRPQFSRLRDLTKPLRNEQVEVINREYVLIHIIYSLHLYNEVIHTHT